MDIRRVLGSRVNRKWDLVRAGKGAEPAYWLGGFGAKRPAGATGIRFGIIAIDTWQKKASRYDALVAEKARNAERSRLARWAAGGGSGDRYGSNGEPMLSSPKLATADLQVMSKIRASQPGHLLYAACALATAIELQRCWSNPILDSAAIRIDLDDEIRQIAAIAVSISDAEQALGPKPAGELAKNDEVMSIFTARRGALDERVDLLLERVQTLNRYWENLKNLDNEFDRLEWIREKSTDDGRDNTIAVEQERQQLTDAARRTEDLEGVGDAVMQSLIDDAHRIFKLNENN